MAAALDNEATTLTDLHLLDADVAEVEQVVDRLERRGRRPPLRDGFLDEHRIDDARIAGTVQVVERRVRAVRMDREGLGRGGRRVWAASRARRVAAEREEVAERAHRRAVLLDVDRLGRAPVDLGVAEVVELALERRVLGV
eukprot:CAMPEP_0185692562 /NCGR_PEP_ID=MMETSP1164-20130828/2621_1 /TAXON_ID=1104430 /ORGANISM="Chrysoreinhardia sp, Strain CCMP2950" /LENGTH=140 /DNA_ID=CAMNT_0028359299 /DNA_START=224 /DNA_END=644 /DNA_ORIENTATION=+